MDRFKVTRNVAYSGIFANTFLVIIKLIIGFSSKSQAMIADGLNSAGDVFSSVITLIGNAISSQPEDNSHPYGHGKAEYIFSMIISFSLFFVAFNILKSSFYSIIKHEEIIFSFWLVIVAVITIVIKIVLFIFCIRIGRKHDNLLVIANAEDHRNDVFITLSTLISIVLSQFGIYWIDGIVGIGISIWIGYTGATIFLSSYNVLMDTNIDEKVKGHIINEVKKIEGVDHIDNITAKPIGLHFILIVKVSVDGNLTVHESHAIAADVKFLLKELHNIEDVIVHVNPA